MNIEKLQEANTLAVEIRELTKHIEHLDRLIDPNIKEAKAMAVVVRGVTHSLPLDEAAMVRIAKQARGNLVKHLRRFTKKLKGI